MCGRYRNMQTWSDLHAALSSFLGPPSQPALNLAPREQVRPTELAPGLCQTNVAARAQHW